MGDTLDEQLDKLYKLFDSVIAECEKHGAIALTDFYDAQVQKMGQDYILTFQVPKEFELQPRSIIAPQFVMAMAIAQLREHLQKTDAEITRQTLSEAVNGSMLLQKLLTLEDHRRDLTMGSGARQNLGAHRNQLRVEADEFWEDWRRLYWQRVNIFGDGSGAAAIGYVRDEMGKRSASHPKTGKLPSERRCWDQLLREPSVDWRPESLAIE